MLSVEFTIAKFQLPIYKIGNRKLEVEINTQHSRLSASGVV
jgi:hypothetical protein